MAAKIKAEHGFTPELVAGSGGIFNVEMDDTLIFSKHDLGRFPEDSEILDKLT